MHSFYNTSSRSGQGASKADQIRALFRLHLTDKEIAAQTGYLVAYIRAVRGRTSRDGFPIERPADWQWKAAHQDRCAAYVAIHRQRRRGAAQ